MTRPSFSFFSISVGSGVVGMDAVGMSASTAIATATAIPIAKKIFLSTRVATKNDNKRIGL
jgi:hypothetical protein